MFAELLPGDFVCCGTDEFTSPIDFFVLRTWILEFLEESKKMTSSGHNIILIGDGCVCARLSLSLFAWTAFSVAVICGRLVLLSCNVNLCFDIL